MNLTVKNITKAATAATAPIALGIGLAMAPVDYSTSINNSIENAQVSIVTNTAFAGGRQGGTSGQDDTGKQDAETKNGDTGTTTPCSDCSTTSPTTPETPTEKNEDVVTYVCSGAVYKHGSIYKGSVYYQNQRGYLQFTASKFPDWGENAVSYKGSAVSLKDCKNKIITEFLQRGGELKGKKQITRSGAKPAKRGSVYVPQKPLPKNSTVLSYGACVNNSAIEKIRGEVKKRTLSSEALVRNDVRDVTKSYNGYTYPVTDAQLADLKVEDCSTYAFSRKDDVICTFPTEDGSTPAIAFAKGASCGVKEEKPATLAQQTGQACDAKVITASMYFNQAPVNNVVTATVNGVMVNGEMVDQKIVDFKGNQIIGIDCNNNIKDGLDAYANIVATTQKSTFLEKGADGKHKNLSLNKQFHGVVNEPACMSVEKICKAAQSTNSVLGLPEVKRQTMARKNG